MRIALLAPSSRLAGIAQRWSAAGTDVVPVRPGPDLLALRHVDAIATSTRRRSAALAAFAWSRARGVPLVLDAGSRRAGLLIERAEVLVDEDGFDLQGVTAWPCDTALRSELGIGDGFVVAAIGSRGQLEAAARRIPEVHFLFVGGSVPDLPNVTVTRRPSRSRLPRYIAAADVLYATTRRDAAAYLAAARPVIGPHAFIEDAGAGWMVAPRDLDALVEAIRDAAADPIGAGTRGEVGRLYALDVLDRDRIAAGYLETLRTLIG